MGLVGSKVANIHTVSSKHWAAHWTTIHRGARKQWSTQPLWNKGHAYSHGNIVAEVAVVHSVSWKAAKHGHCNLSTHSLLLQSFALASSASFPGFRGYQPAASLAASSICAMKAVILLRRQLRNNRGQPLLKNKYIPAQHANSRTSTLAVGKRELLRRSVLREHGQGPMQANMVSSWTLWVSPQWVGLPMGCWTLFPK